MAVWGPGDFGKLYVCVCVIGSFIIWLIIGIHFVNETCYLQMITDSHIDATNNTGASFAPCLSQRLHLAKLRSNVLTLIQ